MLSTRKDGTFDAQDTQLATIRSPAAALPPERSELRGSFCKVHGTE